MTVIAAVSIVGWVLIGVIALLLERRMKEVATRKMTMELASWLFFSIIYSLLPIGASFVFRSFGGHAATVADVLGGGELLLIAGAISADAIGRMFLAVSERRLFTIVAGGGATILLVLSALLFGYVSSSDAGMEVGRHGVALTSITLYGMSVVLAGGCVAMLSVASIEE